MNYAEMSDFEIDVAVAGIIDPGRKITNFAGEAVVWFGNLETRIVRYCKSWADAGPIIVSNKISLHAPNLLESWSAEFVGSDDDVNDGYKVDYFHHRNINPLRAAMIVFLMMQEQPNA